MRLFLILRALLWTHQKFKPNLNAHFSIFRPPLFFIISPMKRLYLAEEKIRKCLAHYTTRVKSSSNHIICTEDKHVVLVLILMNPWIKFQSRMMKTSSEYDKSTPRSSPTMQGGQPPPLAGCSSFPGSSWKRGAIASGAAKTASQSPSMNSLTQNDD